MANELFSLIPYCDGTTLGQMNCWLADKAGETMLIGGLTLAGGYFWGRQKERSKLKQGLNTLTHGRYQGTECILTHTRYEQQPDGKYLQRIRGVKGPKGTGTINLETDGIFHGDVKDIAVKIIMEATKFCTSPDEGTHRENNPVVFDHLCKVRIKRSRLDLRGTKVTEKQASEIISQWQQYWGAASMDSPLDGVQQTAGEQGHGEHAIFPVLAYEADDNIRKKQLRVIFMPAWKVLQVGGLPQRKNVMVESGYNGIDTDPKHPHLDRVDTERAIARVINGNPLLLKKGWVGVSKRYPQEQQPAFSTPLAAAGQPGSLQARLSEISRDDR